MPVEIVQCEQNTPEWLEARLGIPTASNFKTIKAEGKDGGGSATSATRRTYMLKLAGEILTGQPAENYTNADMERGHEMEGEAREMYALTRDAEPQIVGFIRNGNVGCSPDSLLGDDGGLEIKTAAPHIQIDRLLKGKLPPEHVAQVQGTLWVTERQWWDFVSYWPGLPMLVVRVERDEGYIRQLASAVEAFSTELDALVQSIKTYRGFR